MKTLSNEVKSDITVFLQSAMPEFIEDAKEYDGLDLTIACDDEGSTWNFQTGDNSFTGGAYSLPHWAVTTIYPDSDAAEVTAEVIDQLEELLPANR